MRPLQKSKENRCALRRQVRPDAVPGFLRPELSVKGVIWKENR